MRSVKEVLNVGRSILAKNNIDLMEARLLLSCVLGVRKEDIIKINECTDEEFAKFLLFIERRVSGEPYAYIVGHKEFMGLDFFVNSNVLIPREDTEVLVEKVISLEKKKILDMCTGSGCIAVSLAKFIEGASVFAADISEEALNVAKSNAEKNNVLVNFVHSDLFNNINDKFDVIVSNPPYIKTDVIDSLQIEVKKEPFIALDGGKSGLDFYKKIVELAPNFLNKNGVLAFEIGFDQAFDVSQMMEKDFENIEVIKDFGGNDRVVIGSLRG